MRNIGILFFLVVGCQAFLPGRHLGSRVDRSIRQINKLVLRSEPLASEGEWTAHLDNEGTGLVYYFNARTGQSMWEPPTASFPSVTLDADQRQIAKRKQEEYIKAVKVQQDEEGGTGFLSSLLDTNEPEEKVVEEKGGNDWFKSIFEERMNRQQQDLQQAEANVVESTPEPEVMQEPEPAVDESRGPKGPSLLDRIFAKPEPQVINTSDEDNVVAPIKIDISAYVLPHPNKVRWGGEDAVFVKGRTFGVFDGVSGADKLDGVPLYSKTLAKEMIDTVGDDPLDAATLSKRLLEAATIADKIATGASTALVASIGEDGFLRALNVGDSTSIIVRNGKVVAKTKEISHYFECPYQLSEDSPDRPRDGTKLNLELMAGDLIIMASDGIFDNLFEKDIVEIATNGPKPPSIIAKRLADQSRKMSLKKDVETPYAILAKKYGDQAYASGLGGKVDDVSCIVVRYG